MRNLQKYLRFILLAFAMGDGAWSQATAMVSLHLSAAPESRLWLEGTSTLHAYSSKSTTFVISGIAESAEDHAALGLMMQGGQIKTVDVAVPVEGLKSGESKLDKNLYKALQSKEFPDISFHLSSYRVEPDKENPLHVDVTAKGTLTIHGRTKTITLESEAEATDDRVKVAGQQDVLMTDFGIKPPTFMLGAMKVGNRVVVHYEIILIRGKP